MKKVMKVVYRYYEPNQGLEEVQAKIYTEASGFSASADEIKESFQGEVNRLKTALYALTEDGQPLAYVQARDSGSRLGTVRMSFPWAMLDCPAEVQEKIFDEMVDFLKKRKETLEITSPVLVNTKNIEEKIDFFYKKKFIEKERIYLYCPDYDVTEVSNREVSREVCSFNTRLATTEDLDLLIEICQADSFTRRMFPTQEAATNYFQNRVLKDGHVVLVFQDGKIVAAGAPLRLQPDNRIVEKDEGERIIIRFSAMRAGYSQAWHKLFIEIAKECLASGWSNIPLRVYFWFYAESSTAISLAEIQPEIKPLEIIFVFHGK